MNLFLGICGSSLVVALTAFAAQVQSAPTAKAPVQQQQTAAVPEHGRVDAASGARTFATNCSGCHGADARGGERAPDIATRRQVVSLSDNDIESVIRNGKPGAGMPAFAFLGDQGITDLLAHLRALQGRNQTTKITGNATAGRTLFFGEAQCSQCHMMKGEGGFIGSELTDYAQAKTPEAIRSAIIDPDVVVTPTSELVELSLSSGEHVSGLARAEDNFAITLQTVDGHWRTVDKTRIAKEQHTGRSTHPRYYGSRLSQEELDDLVGYLMTVASEAPLKPATRRNR